MDIEITGGIITRESLLESFSKVSDKMSGSTSMKVEVKPTQQEVSQEPASPASASLQERVDRAKVLVEQRKAEKETQESDKEKTKERERREVGKVRGEVDIDIVTVEEYVLLGGAVILSEADTRNHLLDC